jgi:S1-C subfamily serine protease
MTALAESKVKDSQEWAKTIENVKKGVCYIVFRHSDQIDGFPAISDSGTGFYVDAEHGYVLTNRHIAGPGPFAGYVVFNSYMEVSASLLLSDRH